MSQVNNSESSQFIKSEAVRLGFSKCGIAKAEILGHESAHFDEWLRLGYNATMKWMERNVEKRKDISLILENAKSVVVCSANYFNPRTDEGSDEKGKISNYAWGMDYHLVIEKKLKQLAELIESNFDAKAKVYVDTGPILEKAWAVKAGIGWQGKNSLILTKELGSYHFLGIIICDIELDYDSEVNDFCGKCTACIDACPVNAIGPAKVIDSNKCLSYWTIEAKAYVEIPDDIKNKMDGWLFGCDICQQVCPWNRKCKESDIIEFKAIGGREAYTTDEVLKMDDVAFSARFRNTPVQRLKLSGLKRNSEALKIYYEKKR